jgi:hypothetical protein
MEAGPARARSGDTMSAAKHVREIGPRMEWFSIEDHAGKVWRYQRARPVDLAEPAQVEGHYTKGLPIRAVLVRDDDGHVMVHGNGMPRSIVVDHIDDPHSPLLGLLGISPKEEYVLVA